MIFSSYTLSKLNRPPEEINCENWPLPFHETYSRFQHAVTGQHILFAQDEESGAILPIQVVKNILLRQGRIVFAPVCRGEELSHDEQSVFLHRLEKALLKSGTIDRFLQPHPIGMTLSAPHASKSVPFGTYINYLQNHTDEAALLDSFDPKYKKAIMHSVQHRARIDFSECCYADFYNLYTQTTERAGIYRDTKDFFDRARHILTTDRCLTGVVYDEEGPVGGLFIVYTKYAAFCTHAGSCGRNSRIYGAMKHLHFEAMKTMRAAGVIRYDLVGVRISSSNERLAGVFRFKKGFGGELKQGYLWKKDIHEKPAKLYDIIQKIRGVAKHADIIDQENPLP